MVGLVLILVFIGLLIGAGILHLAFLAYWRFAALPPKEISRPATPASEMPPSIPGVISIRVTPRHRHTRRVPDLMAKMSILFAAMLAQIAIAFGLVYLGLANQSLLSGLLAHSVYLLVLTALIAKAARIELVQACIVTAFYLGFEIAFSVVLGGAIAGVIIVLDREKPGKSDTVIAEERPSPPVNLEPGQDVNILIDDSGSGYSSHAALVIREFFGDYSTRTTPGGRHLVKVTIQAYKGGDFDSFQKRIQIGTVRDYDPQTNTVRVEIDPQKDKLIKSLFESQLGSAIPHPSLVSKGTRVFAPFMFRYLPATVDSYDGVHVLVRFDGVQSKQPWPIRVDELRYPPATQSSSPR